MKNIVFALVALFLQAAGFAEAAYALSPAGEDVVARDGEGQAGGNKSWRR